MASTIIISVSTLILGIIVGISTNKIISRWNDIAAEEQDEYNQLDRNIKRILSDINDLDVTLSKNIIELKKTVDGLNNKINNIEYKINNKGNKQNLSKKY